MHANNEVLDGINYVASEMAKGNLFFLDRCKETIKSIERYTWDSKAAERGEDKPIKRFDDACDAVRYALFSHKVSVYDPYKLKGQQEEWMKNRYQITRRF